MLPALETLAPASNGYLALIESIYSVLGGAGGNGALYFFKVSIDSDFSKQNQRKEVGFNFQYCGGITPFSPQGNVTV